MSYLEKILRSVSPYEPGDKPALREFQREYFGPTARHLDDAFEEWLFMRNPDARGPTLWLSKRDGVVVGQQGLIPIRLKVDDAEFAAAWLIDLMVRHEWRMKGVPPALLTSSTRTVDVMLGLGIEDEAFRTLSRAGWKEVTRMSYFVRPLDPQACGAGIGAPRLLTRLSPRPLFRGSARLIGRLAALASRTKLERIERFDERVDAIWAAAKKSYPIVVKRDLGHVRWRFDDAPEGRLYQRYYLTHKGEAVGYAVTRLQPWHGYTAASVVDYFAPRRYVMPLLAQVIRELDRERAVAVFIDQIHANTERTLLSLGCLRVRASWRFMFKVADPESPLAARLADAASWLVLPADSDYEHIVIAAPE
jgi:hypothetical protein